MARKRMVVVTVQRVRPFDEACLAPPDDNRRGTWHADLRFELADEVGDNRQRCDDPYLGSGLCPRQDEAENDARDLARNIVRAFRATGVKAVMVDANADATREHYEPTTLAYHLEQIADKVERETRAAELKAQAHELLTEAKALVS